MRQTEPTYITQGERVQWQRACSEFSAAEYDLQYRFRGQGDGLNVDATADGSAFVAEITAEQSHDLSTGRYRWQAWLTEIADATNTFPFKSGFLTVEPGFAADDTDEIDLRSTAKQIVDAIDTALLSSAGDVIEYEVNTPSGTKKVKRSRDEAMKTRNYYASIVEQQAAKERAAQGKSINQTVSVRFID